MSERSPAPEPELETRLAEALVGTAERAPYAADLAAGARSRLRRRRRTTAAVVAAVLAAVAVPVAISVLGDSSGSGPDRDDSTVAEPPAGWRTETWRDLSLRVPPDWTWGSGTDWCARDQSAETATPVVSRTVRKDRTLACAPTYGYGVHYFLPSGGELPPGTEGVVQQYRGRRYPWGAWIGYATTGRAAVWVVTDSRTLTRQVLDSTEPVGEVDANGCASRVEMLSPRVSDRISVCRYAQDGWLEQSELLSRSDSGGARRAVLDAPYLSSAPVVCWPTDPGNTTISLVGDRAVRSLSVTGRCAGTLVANDADRLRSVTRDVLYWALSPGWAGAVEEGVPVPDRLRTGVTS